MTISSKLTKIVALMLVIVMAASSLFGCIVLPEGFGGNSNNNGDNTNAGDDPTPDDPTPDDPTPDDPKPEEHKHVYGDWVTVKEATTTEDGLQERTCQECGNVEQNVIEASGKEYSVSYRNIKTADYPTPNGYNSSEGLLTLPEIKADGYRFIGWYTASIGGELVDYIPKGSKKDYILFAHWELIEYDITYKNVPDNINPTTYTIESSLKLTTPEWSGLKFSHWSDENGNVYMPDENITFMPKQTFGDLVLTANWKVLRNIATPPKSQTLYNVFSGEEGLVYFYYDLGTIEHVVLDDINPNLYYKAEGMPIELTLSKTVTVSETKANSISNTISQAISKTDSWASSYSKAETHSKEWNAEIGGGISGSIGGGHEGGVNVGVDKIGVSAKKFFNWSVSAHIEGSYNWGKSSSETENWSNSESHSTTTNEEQSKTINSSLEYMKEITSEIAETYSISSSLPEGYYAYVHAGNIRVIGVVTYEIATGNLYLNTYCRLDNMHSMMMYYSDVNQLNNPAIDGLDFDIPEEDILYTIQNSYYVRYEANGGEGSMPMTMHTIGGYERLATNEFTKSGNVFTGWERDTETGVELLFDGQSVSNLAEPHQVVTLKASWAYNGPVWKEVSTGTNYYIKSAYPTGFDKDNELCAKYNNEKIESGIDGDVKIVVTEEKFHTYVYWHWAYRNDKIYNYFVGAYENEKLPNGKYAKYFTAFESTKNCGHKDETGAVDQSVYYYNTGRSKDGSWWWYRFEVYVQTYTIYENINP